MSTVDYSNDKPQGDSLPGVKVMQVGTNKVDGEQATDESRASQEEAAKDPMDILKESKKVPDQPTPTPAPETEPENSDPADINSRIDAYLGQTAVVPEEYPQEQYEEPDPEPEAVPEELGFSPEQMDWIKNQSKNSVQVANEQTKQQEVFKTQQDNFKAVQTKAAKEVYTKYPDLFEIESMQDGPEKEAKRAASEVANDFKEAYTKLNLEYQKTGRQLGDDPEIAIRAMEIVSHKRGDDTRGAQQEGARQEQERQQRVQAASVISSSTSVVTAPEKNVELSGPQERAAMRLGVTKEKYHDNMNRGRTSALPKDYYDKYRKDAGRVR